ncbi:Protein N-terminal and lysine N-methyltransferase efm7 [Pseudocercospora fuligena]|uniref:Protein N-terminal and lysine N-methyltransferase EFM7 n=1 Tax=Pseudocercospora fuligena TaxID=685502 RepID=A0A8H6RT71_9PEZI|nr:Protein N-terminal and lysine N-methyltransferase efm7 [Pseudocercospora fuligena]
MDKNDSESEGGDDLFREPEDYYQPEKQPTVVQHRTISGQNLKLHLIGSSPLWGHLLWQGGRTVANFLENNQNEYVKSKTVLELGAGAGLPSLICAINGAKQVVVTDYPDQDLIDNLRQNISDCHLLTEPSNMVAQGFLWGGDATILKSHLPDKQQESGFDLLILADLLFNHSEHHRLLSSIQSTLKKSREASALVFFTPYRPWLFEKDMAFFDLAKSGGFVVEKVLETFMDKVMFEEDPGDELLRRTVFGYRLKWA